MSLTILTSDCDTLRLCREALSGLLDDVVEASYGATAASSEAVQIKICDISSELDLPVPSGDFCRYIFLVTREQLEFLVDRAHGQSVTFVLKPVSRSRVRLAVEQALAQLEREAEHNSQDRDQMLQYLLEANVKLHEYDEDRNRFLSRAMHDCRVPISSIQGYASLLRAGALGSLNERQEAAIQCIFQSAERLAWMSAGLFDLSSRSPSPREVENTRLAIGSCIENAVSEMMPLTSRKNIVIHTHLRLGANHSFCFSRFEIHRVLINLLENANKFTPHGGTIDIDSYPVYWDRRSTATSLCAAASEDWNSVRVDIIDSGPGMPASYKDAPFEDRSTSAAAVGRTSSGLGLVICKTIVENHSGRIWFEPRACGAQVSFVLPVWKLVC